MYIFVDLRLFLSHRASILLLFSLSCTYLIPHLFIENLDNEQARTPRVLLAGEDALCRVVGRSRIIACRTVMRGSAPAQGDLGVWGLGQLG